MDSRQLKSPIYHLNLQQKSVSVSACPAGWTGFLEHCYLYVKLHSDWEAARSYCQDQQVHTADTTLVSVDIVN